MSVCAMEPIEPRFGFGGVGGYVWCVSKPPHHPLGEPQSVCSSLTKLVMYDGFSQISCFTCVAPDLTRILRNGG